MISDLLVDHQIAVIESRIRHFRRLSKASTYPADQLVENIDEAIGDIERLLTRGTHESRIKN